MSIMNENKITLRKHRAIIQMSNIKAVQRKAYNVLLHQAYEQRNEDRFSIQISAIKRIGGIGDSSNKRLKESLVELMTTIVQMDIINGSQDHWKAVPLLGEVEIIDGTVYFDLPRTILEAVLHPDRYATIDLTVFKGLRSKYAIALYELARDYAKREIPKMTIEEFRKLMGVEDGKYTNFSDLKRFVIDRALKEIEANEKIPFYLEVKPIKGPRRRIEAVKFKIHKKRPKTPALPVEANIVGGTAGHREILDPKKFREEIVEKFRGRPLCNRAPGWLPEIVFGISKAGYIRREDTGEDLTPEDAKKIWAWLFENQDRAGKIEEVGEVERIASKFPGHYFIANARSALGTPEEIKCYPKRIIEKDDGGYRVEFEDETGKRGYIEADSVEYLKTFSEGLKDV